MKNPFFVILFSILLLCDGLMIASRHLHTSTSDLLGTGVLIMGGVYVISTMVIKFRGLGDE